MNDLSHSDFGKLAPIARAARAFARGIGLLCDHHRSPGPPATGPARFRSPGRLFGILAWAPRRGAPGYRTSDLRRSYESRARRDGFALKAPGRRRPAKVLLVAILLIDLFFLQLPGGHFLPTMRVLLLLLPFLGLLLFGEIGILDAVALSFWGALGVFVFARGRGPEAVASAFLVLLLGLIAWLFFVDVKHSHAVHQSLPLGMLVLCILGFAWFPLWRPPDRTPG